MRRAADTAEQRHFGDVGNGSRPIAREQASSGNLFVDALEDETARRFRRDLEFVTLLTHETIARPGSVVRFAVFPVESIISLVASLADGSAVEITVVGRDGFFGLPIVFGDPQTPHLAEIQVPGSGWRMPSETFARHLRDEPDLRAASLRFAAATAISTAQFCACNRLHEIDERFARWILMAHDRVAGDALSLTQEYLATMLGVRRAGVGIAASRFERENLIGRSRGLVHILDRARLLAVACECYAFVNDQQTRLMRYDVRKT